MIKCLFKKFSEILKEGLVLFHYPPSVPKCLRCCRDNDQVVADTRAQG